MSDSLVDPDFFNKQNRPSRGQGCLRSLLWMGLALLLVMAGLAVFFGWTAKGLLERGLKVFERNFWETKVTTEHREIVLEIRPTHGDVLEVASPMTAMEYFQRSDERYAAWGWVYLGRTTSEIKVPATYRFHIKLSELKRARLENGVLTVTAPAVTPSLPVAIDTSQMEKKAAGTWLRFDAAQQLAELEKSMTPDLNKRAEGHVSTVREIARKDIAEFVQKWIVEAHPDYAAQVRALRVVFPGEKEESVRMEPLPPLP